MGMGMGNSMGNGLGANMGRHNGNMNATNMLAAALSNVPLNAINQAVSGMKHHIGASSRPSFTHNNISNNSNNNSNSNIRRSTGPGGLGKQPLLSLPTSSGGPGASLLGNGPYGGGANPEHSRVRRSSGIQWGLLGHPAPTAVNQSRLPPPSSSSATAYGINNNNNKQNNWPPPPSSLTTFLDRGRPAHRINNNNNNNRGLLSNQQSARVGSRFDSRSSSSHRDRRDNVKSSYINHKPSQGLLSTPSHRIEDGQQEYDPAQPTEEPDPYKNQNDRGILHGEHQSSPSRIAMVTRKRTRSPSPQQSSDLRVTINSQGRSVSQDIQVKRGYSEDDISSRRRNSESSDVSSRHSDGRGDGNHGNRGQRTMMCHACSLDCRNTQGFEQHMRSTRHQQRMQEIMNLHMAKTDQQLQRIREEENLRKVEGTDKEDYCRICDKRFPGSFISHRKSQEHRRKERLTKRGCKLCDTGTFNQYPEYVKHIDCESHKQKKEELRRQEKERGEDKERVEDEDGDFPESLDDLVTVDATGIYNEDDEVMSDAEDEAHKSRSRSTVEKSDADIVNNVQIMKSEETTSDTDDQPTEGILSTANETDLCEVDDLKFDPTSPIGQEYVATVTGFFCKLCAKFYQSEFAARVNHCQTKQHFDKYQSAMQQKVKTPSLRGSSTSPPPAKLSKLHRQSGNFLQQHYLATDDAVSLATDDAVSQEAAPLENGVPSPIRNNILNNNSEKDVINGDQQEEEVDQENSASWENGGDDVAMVTEEAAVKEEDENCESVDIDVTPAASPVKSLTKVKATRGGATPRRNKTRRGLCK
jgi:hypothetical protein